LRSHDDRNVACAVTPNRRCSTLVGNREAHESLTYALMGRCNPATCWTTASVDQLLDRNIPPATFIAP
jgi:hypothetical protein